METPTPVSAFMHAGIINAGGFLVLRLSPLFSHAPGALTLLAVLGTLTAAFGAVVMLAQPSVKRALAYSTIAQMGFMLLQCGMGAYGLALLHLVAHSLYKAHAFLHAGSTIGAVPRAAVPLRSSALAFGALAGGLLVAGLAWVVPTAPGSPALFSVVLACALAYGLARTASIGPGPRTVVFSLGLAAGLAGLALLLHNFASTRLGFPPAPALSPVLLGVITAVFLALFLFQALLWRAGHYALGRRLYVHALNGFYVGTHANRLLGRLWPRATA